MQEFYRCDAPVDGAADQAHIQEILLVGPLVQQIEPAGERVAWKDVECGIIDCPVDHPHGGGEGKTAAGRDPVSPWGTPTKGYRTRRNKRTDSMIVQRRHKK